MKSLRALAVVLAAVLPVAALAEPPDPAVGAAHKKLEAAREHLAQAVKKVEKDPPATADLDLAHAAVGALKDAIDAAAPHETKDLELAKSMLAARKELRTQREFVDQRRANVHIFDLRRKLDVALERLKESARGIEAKAAEARDFEEARAAAVALKKGADEGRQFAKQDPKFASYLGELDAALAKHNKLLDERGTKILVDKAKVQLEDARKGLTAAMGELGKGATDAQFKAADEAVKLLGQRTEESKDLEPKDQGYGAAASAARKELAAAKKKMDELWTETGLARLKAEIEPAHKDLATALKAIRARKPTPEQLAEAKTAAVVVRKLLEKFQPEAARSKAFGDWINSEVKKTLTEVDVELERRNIDAARADATAALRAVEKRGATDEQFGELTTALTVLEKTAAAAPKDPAISPLVQDAKTFIKDAKATMAKRRVEVDVQRQKEAVDAARKNASELVRGLSQPKVGNEELLEAENAVKQISAVLAGGAALAKKDRDYAQYDKDAKQKITELEGRIAAKKQSMTVNNAKAALTQAVADAKAKLDAAKLPAATDAEVEGAAKAVEQINKLIEGSVALTKQEPGYLAAAERALDQYYRLSEQAQIAQVWRDFRKLTNDSIAAGMAEMDQAAAKSELRAKKAHFDKALAQFKACEADGGKLLRQVPIVAKTPVVLDGAPSTPKDLLAACGTRAQSTEAQLKEVVPLISFDEGPKKAYEAAAGHLAKSQKTEALAQFDECFASGMILQNRAPELKERTFTVAGSGMTLVELIAKCSEKRKALRGK